MTTYTLLVDDTPIAVTAETTREELAAIIKADEFVANAERAAERQQAMMDADSDEWVGPIITPERARAYMDSNLDTILGFLTSNARFAEHFRATEGREIVIDDDITLINGEAN
nr:hypothetical protein [Actinomyces sp.]